MRFKAFFLVPLLFASVASAGRLSLELPSEQTAGRGAGRSFEIVRFDVPADLNARRLDRVILEFAVTVVPLSEEDAEAPSEVGAFPLTEDYVSGTPVFESAVPSMRPVMPGDDRLVKLDITNSVKCWIATPSANHGLVVGSLTGPEVATVTLSPEALGPGSAFRVSFLYQERAGTE